MILTNEQLNEITDAAEMQFSLTQIAIFVNLNDYKFKYEAQKEDSPIYLAVQKGYLKQEMIVRRSVFSLARSGSSPAQQMAKKYILDRELDNIYEE